MNYSFTIDRKMNSASIEDELIKNMLLNQEFTYHRHSEEKSMIYFRCSDKKCKARAIFNKTTGKFIRKNNHLSQIIHKPNSTKAITAHQMAKISEYIKGPILLSENSDEDFSLICNETLNQPTAKPEVLENDNSSTLLKFLAKDSETSEKICQSLVENGLAVSAEIFYNQKKMKISKGKQCRKVVVEVLTCEEFKDQILTVCEEFFGTAEVESFKKL